MSHRTRSSRAPVRYLLCVLGVATPAFAQQVVGHVPLLPGDAGRNIARLEALAADPTGTDVFALTPRGLAAIDSLASPGFVSVDLAGQSGAGFAPGGIAIDRVSHRVFVGDAAAREVVVVDGATRAVLTRLAVPVAPRALLFDSTHQRLYSIPTDGTPITVIDGCSLATLGTIDTACGEPQVGGAALFGANIAVNERNGKLYCTNDPLGKLFSFDLDFRRAEVSIGGVNLFVLNSGAGAQGRLFVGFAVVDSATDTKVATVAPYTILAADASTGTSYGASGGQLVRVDAANAVSLFPLGGSPPATGIPEMVVDEAGQRLLVREQPQGWSTDRVAVFDVSSAVPVRVGDVAVGVFPHARGMAWSSGGRRLYLPLDDLPALTEVDPAGLRYVETALGAVLGDTVVNDAAGVAFVTEKARGAVSAVRVTGVPAAVASTPIFGVPSLLALDTLGRSELYVVNESTRSLATLDAVSGGQVRSTPSILAPQAAIAFTVDRGVAGGSIAFLLHEGGGIEALRPALVDAGLALECSASCGGPELVATNEATHRTNLGLDVIDDATRMVATTLDDAGSGCPRWPARFAVVDAATNQVFSDRGCAASVFAMQDAGTPDVVEIPTAAAAVAAAVRGSSLYLAESAGVEVVDTIAHAVVDTYATGGRPAALLAQPGNALLWIEDPALQPPGIQVWDASGQHSVLTDLASAGQPREHHLAGQASGRVVFADQRHGTLAVLDPAVSGTDLQIVATPLPGGTAGAAYAVSLGVSGGTGPFSWEVVSGRLPPGLALDAATGTIAGTPAAQGTDSFLVRVEDRGLVPARVDVQDFQISILDLRLLPACLAVGCVSSPYQVALPAAGGTPPYTWSQGGLPPWATLDPATGTISGIPDGPLTCPPAIDVTVTDVRGTSVGHSLCLTIEDVPADPGNVLRATRAGDDVVLSWMLPADPFAFDVYRYEPRGPLVQIPSGTALPPSTRTSPYVDAGAVVAPPPLYGYLLTRVNACGITSAR